MIAFARPTDLRNSPRGTRRLSPRHQQRFLQLLPQIEQQARVAFRGLGSEQRQELIAEVIANAYVAFARLVQRGIEDSIYATPLAQFAIRQVRTGRRVGGKLNVKDVTSVHCQRRKGVQVESLTRYNQRKEQWQELVVEDRTAGPADVAATRIDFGEWLRTLPGKQSRIALLLATGESTSAAARKFGLSPARISQLRRELLDEWNEFHAMAVLESRPAA